MEKLRREVRAVGPHQGLELWMDAELLKHHRIAQRLEDGAAKCRPQIDLTRCAVTEAQPDRESSAVLRVENVVVRVGYSNGSFPG